MIPSIVIRPDINELQDLMVQAGKMMVGVAKGVGQWSGNKKTKVRHTQMYTTVSNGTRALLRPRT